MDLNIAIARWEQHAPKEITIDNVAYKFNPEYTLRDGSRLLLRYHARMQKGANISRAIQFTLSYGGGLDRYNIKAQKFNQQIDVVDVREIHAVGFKQFKDLENPFVEN